MRRAFQKRKVYLKESILFLRLQLIGTKKLETAKSFFGGETILITLEQFKDIVNNDGLEVDFLLVVKILRLQLNLWETLGNKPRWAIKTHS